MKTKNGWVDTLEAYQYARRKLEALGLEQNPQMSARKGKRQLKHTSARVGFPAGLG